MIVFIIFNLLLWLDRWIWYCVSLLSESRSFYGGRSARQVCEWDMELDIHVLTTVLPKHDSCSGSLVMFDLFVHISSCEDVWRCLTPFKQVYIWFDYFWLFYSIQPGMNMGWLNIYFLYQSNMYDIRWWWLVYFITYNKVSIWFDYIFYVSIKPGMTMGWLYLLVWQCSWSDKGLSLWLHLQEIFFNLCQY